MEPRLRRLLRLLCGIIRSHFAPAPKALACSPATCRPRAECTLMPLNILAYRAYIFLNSCHHGLLLFFCTKRVNK